MDASHSTPKRTHAQAIEANHRPPAGGRKLPYRWLLFDADGTLFDYERAEKSALEQTFRTFGAVFDAGCLAAYRRINLEMWQTLEKGGITPEALKIRRFELLLEALGLAHPPARFSETYLACLGACTELVDGAEELLESFARKYRIAIVTNGLQTVQRSRLARSSIRRHIAEIIISEEIGFAKPDGRFFDVAFARFGQPSRAEALMIGDSWTSDILGAAQYGLDTCWFNPGRKPRPDNPPITREIASLRELSGWLG